MAGDRNTPKAASEELPSRDWEAEIAEWQDKYLRLQAEFDNFRKRTLREKMELVQSGSDGKKTVPYEQRMEGREIRKKKVIDEQIHQQPMTEITMTWRRNMGKKKRTHRSSWIRTRNRM